MAKVLIVDDEPICTRMLSLVLQEKGYSVAVSESGEEAVELGKSFNPDILVSDWKLSRALDGVEAAREILQFCPELKIILFSGLPAEALEARAEGLSVFKILEKPCRAEEIAALVQQALDS